MAKQKVLLTGASGSMGSEALRELLRRRDKYDIVLLLRPHRPEKKLARHHRKTSGMQIVWGDLGHADDVERALEGVDWVLHPAAFISPAADHAPAQARKSNAEGTRNLVAGCKKRQDRGEKIRFIYIASVAQYGGRLPPVHQIRVGDPIMPSVGDYYAITKNMAEISVIESGLDHWAVLRQTYIAIPNTMSLMDPIMFHQPLNTHIELITSQDAGYALVQCLEAPDEMFGRVYNLGGGPSCRVVYSDYLEHMLGIFRLGDYRRLMEPSWFALRNFHCGYYEDSHRLNAYLGHWRQSLDDHYAQVEAAAAWYLKLGGQIGPRFITRYTMRRMADPLKWIKRGDEEKIKAFYGSRQACEQIAGWGQEPPPSTEQVPLVDYDALSVEELATRRGGDCAPSKTADSGKWFTFTCGQGHAFEATEARLRAGHWCPECAPVPWDYDTVAKQIPALGALYYQTHGPDESQKVEYLFEPL